MLGVVVRSIDNDYVCGLNTGFDNTSIPLEYGRITFYLEYPYGISNNGGKYYFDAALFNETVSVAIQYRSVIKEFTVKSEYLGDGRYVIPHEWRRMNE